MEKVLSGLSRVGDDLEMRCAAVGIQSRILTAEGNLPEALGLIGNLLKTLPDDAPLRLRENLTVHRLTLLLMRGETQEVRSSASPSARSNTMPGKSTRSSASLPAPRPLPGRASWATPTNKPKKEHRTEAVKSPCPVSLYPAKPALWYNTNPGKSMV